MFSLKKIYELIAGTSLNDAHEIPVSEGTGPGLTKRYSIAQLKAFLWAYVQTQISGITKGDTGAQGATGAQGIQGSQGEKGLKGDKGDQGLKGDLGLQGAQGIQGPKGDKGEKGDTGAQGVQGIQGEKGDKGDQGNQGTEGAIIVAGEAANILSGITNPTTEGIEGDFYINLSAKLLFGPKSGGTWPEIGIILTGEQGPQGIQGIAGPQGNQGNQGIQGIKGDTGATGPKGDKGDAGATGTNGTNGEAGAIGPAGPQGIQGVQGSQGIQGAKGDTGAAGPKGDKGDKGDAGEGVKAGGTTGQVLTKLSNTDGDADWIDPSDGGSSIPPVESGEKVVTQMLDGTHVDYEAIEQIVPPDNLTGANWSTGTVLASGYAGQISFDNNYRYDCVSSGTWRRSVLNSDLVDLYLSDLDDSSGDKTTADLIALYPNAQNGQRVWGVNNLYEKKSPSVWKKTPAVNA